MDIHSIQKKNVFSGPSCFGDGVIEKGMFAKVTCVIDIVNGKGIVILEVSDRKK